MNEKIFPSYKVIACGGKWDGYGDKKEKTEKSNNKRILTQTDDDSISKIRTMIKLKPVMWSTEIKQLQKSANQADTPPDTVKILKQHWKEMSERYI